MTDKTYHHGNLAAELLQAAERELVLNGIEAFSLRAVAKRAGVSHGAPAYHFKSARGLLTALAATGYERLVEAQKARQSDAGSAPKEQLIAIGLGYLDFAEANPDLFRLMFSSEKPDRGDAHFDTAAKAAFGKLLDGVCEVLGRDPSAHPSAMTQVAASWAMVHGLADLIISGRLDGPLALKEISGPDREMLLSRILLKALA
ncbi:MULTISPECIES: TetR/AcrR family transcriptional regulator [Citromicrobium]|uniref:TetR/AcrR family transcriptional regulator n=1 Tax=Citromicrobium TaxID=72173 RepID=UPI0001DD09B2|nr:MULTISPECIES: TetR/AcrR family transcriptional regulator [Citromicrobium]ALG62201.1 TetR family transcriptional regulator [Citromicrobium sp. JL477]KPM17558.1 TetR family transcriptional regulator [Citromicrobium sp. JL31]KPM18729.1 TetR family transcriptional regulator [Citromicrobium sp. JL1351]KPM30126.1 TetR family transcriptional regulator [Citromicrobium sp. JL2201]